MHRGFFLIGCLLVTSNQYAIAFNGDISLHGELVADPCVFNIASATQTVEFGYVIKKMLYLHQRSQGYRFTVQLDECDVSLGKQVEIIFNGPEDEKQPGLITIQGTAKGIAIGLEDKSRNSIAINRRVLRYPLLNGANTLDFFAYISSSAEDIESQKIVEGDFAATITLEVNYP